MQKSARARRRILAIFLPIAAVLYISCEALDPKGTDQLITDMATGLKLLAIGGRHPTQLYVAGRFPCSPWARSRCRTRRSHCWAGYGAFCGAITQVLVGVDLAAAATAHTCCPGGSR